MAGHGASCQGDTSCSSVQRCHENGCYAARKAHTFAALRYRDIGYDDPAIAAASPASAKPVNIIFDPPGSTGTTPEAINAANWVVGSYYDIHGKTHGFLRMPDGTITTVEPPGATSSTARSVTDAGTIAGEYKDATGDHIFTQSGNGTFASFDIPGAESINNVFVNASGVLAGTFEQRQHL